MHIRQKINKYILSDTLSIYFKHILQKFIEIKEAIS